MADYVVKRKLGYYLKLRIPKGLQENYLTIKGNPKEYLEESLKTRDITIAKKRARQLVARYELEFEDLRRETTDDDPIESIRIHVVEPYREHIRGERDYPFGEFDPNEWWQMNIEHLQDSPSEEVRRKLDALYELYDNPSTLSLHEVIEKCLEERSKELREATVNEQRQRYQEFANWIGSNKPLSRISKPDAGKYIEYLLKKISSRTNQPLSAKTIRDIVSGLSSLFMWAEGRGYCNKNPFDGMVKTIPKRNIGVRDTKEWSPQTILLFLPEARKDKRMLELFAIALYTGMRGREIANLKASSPAENFLQIDEAKNKNSIRDVPVHPIIQPLITQLREQADSDGFLIKGLTVAQPDNNRYKNIGKKMGRVRKALGIAGEVNFHSTRKAISGAFERLGVPQERAARVTGHKPSGITYGLYSGGLEAQQLLKEVAKVQYGDGVEESIKQALAEVCGVAYPE